MLQQKFMSCCEKFEHYGKRVGVFLVYLVTICAYLTWTVGGLIGGIYMLTHGQAFGYLLLIWSCFVSIILLGVSVMFTNNHFNRYVIYIVIIILLIPMIIFIVLLSTTKLKM